MRHSYPEGISKEDPKQYSHLEKSKNEHEERITLLEQKLAISESKLEEMSMKQLPNQSGNSFEGLNFGIKEIETLLNNTEIMQKYTLELKEEIQELKTIQIKDKDTFLTSLDKGKEDIQRRFSELEFSSKSTLSKIKDLEDESQKKKIKFSEVDNEIKSLKYKTYNLEQNFNDFSSDITKIKSSLDEKMNDFQMKLNETNGKISELLQYSLSFHSRKSPNSNLFSNSPYDVHS